MIASATYSPSVVAGTCHRRHSGHHDGIIGREGQQDRANRRARRARAQRQLAVRYHSQPRSHAAARTPLQLILHQRLPTVTQAWFAFIIVQPPHQLDIQHEYTTPPATVPARRSSIDRRCGRRSKANATLLDSERENVHTIYYEPTTDPDSCPFYYRSLVHPFDCIYIETLIFLDIQTRTLNFYLCKLWE